MSRRALLRAAVATPVYRALTSVRATQGLALEHAAVRGFVVGANDADVSQVRLTRDWAGGICRSQITNGGSAAVAIKEVVLFDLNLDLPPSTPIYGESFQMLSQSGGTLGAPKDLGSYTDAKHYKIPVPEGTYTYFGAMTLRAPDGLVTAIGYTSTRRFAGAFRFRPPASLQVVVDTEGLTLAPGESWQLEDVSTIRKKTRDEALADIGAKLAANHPRLVWKTPPTGWCSWYCFGPRVTAQNVLDNLDAIQRKIPGLKYIQIDDGYQPAMGDWLEAGPAFGGDVRKVLGTIKQRGFEPAIWVAPFIAEKDSRVFQEHLDWFVKDADGSPLRSDRVTFGGWRHGPWYVLDGTHPGVQAHFERVFRTMNREWGVTYFKLDATFWGAIHGGRFHDPKATRIEAYRRGMRAILNGAGDSFILGCNHPIWPSAGLIHGSRSSNDIKRDWNRIKTTAEQNLLRNWQNGVLWWNDPDAVCLAGDLPENEFLFHAAAIYATGGMILSGDDLTQIPESRLAILKTLLPPIGVPAKFEGEAVTIGRVNLPGKQMLCLFNPADTPVDVDVPLPRRSLVRDFWNGESLGRVRDVKLTLPARSARLLECLDA